MGARSKPTHVSACTRPKRGCGRPRRSGPWWHGQPWPGRDQGASAMHRSPSLPSATAMPAPDAPRELLTGVPGWQRPGTRGQRRSRLSRSDPVSHRRSRSDCPVHERCRGLPDLRRRTRSPGRAGADRRSQGGSKIYHALDELDQAIRDIRDTIFDRSPPDSPCLSYEGARRTALYTNPRESGANEFPAAAGQQSLMEADGASCSLARGTGRG